MLELRAKSFLRDGFPYGENSKAVMFDVLGLPEGQKVEIGENHYKWQIRREINDGFYSEWSGQFGSAEEALASLQ